MNKIVVYIKPNQLNQYIFDKLNKAIIIIILIFILIKTKKIIIIQH